ncbi:DUF5410 family protein [Rickettsia endosymbiont of Rhinocyllus conicus]|uniref:DUF5410 family protein n=1 Tax=Rickettsia endosymbiont of Rhinocyllus conicus TaxID=3066252 RepID=UPI00313355AA
MLKESKKSQNSITNKNLADLVIEELENENFDLKVLEKIQQAFSTASKQKQREAFISIINTNLKNNQLHKLNRAVMEHASELMPVNDPNFVCRTTDNKIWGELLLLEAKRHGMKAELNSKSELQPLNIKNIPQEILNHYFVLKQKFYPQRDSKDSIDSRIAQSINFLLYAPLFREIKEYEKLSDMDKLIAESDIRNPNGKYVQNLVEKKLAAYIEKHSNTQEKYENKKNEEKEAEISSIIETSIGKLEQNKKIAIEGQQREKIKRRISRFLEEFSIELLTSNKKKLVDIIHQELYQKRSVWSKIVNYCGIKYYKISKENLKNIKEVIGSKICYFTMKPEVRKQLEQLSKQLHKSGAVISSVDKDKQKNLKELKENFKELKKLKNPVLPSKIKQTKSKTKANPPLPKI